MAVGAIDRALVFGLIAAFFFGTHSVIVRYLTHDLHGMSIAVLRLYLAAAVLYVVMKIGGHRISMTLSDRNLLLATAGSILNYIFFHVGLEHTGASNAMMLENTAPFFVIVILALVIRDPVRPIEIVATIIALIGVFLTVRHDFQLGREQVLGDGLEIAAGATWALFIIGSSRALRQTTGTMERMNFLFTVFVLTAIVLTPSLFLFDFRPTGLDWTFLVLLAVFPTAIAYFLWYEAMASVSTVTSALLFVLSVVFTFVNSWLFLGEMLTSGMIIGAVLIIGGVLLPKLAPAKND